MSRIIACSLGAAGALSVAFSEEEALLHADLEKLRDPVAGAVEAARLSGCDGKETIVTGYRLLPCPQPEGAAAMHALMVTRRYDFGSRYVPEEEYVTEDLEGLFGIGKGAVPVVFEVGPQRIEEAHLMVFDDQGGELRPFGGNNVIDSGYFCDFNRDGVLERGDTTHYGVDVAGVSSVEVFELETVTRDPERLLAVAFNWDLDDADDVDDWGFECRDEDGDGFLEIRFGAEQGRDETVIPEVVFRWDAEAGKYVSSEVGDHPRARLIQPDEKLAELAEAGIFGALAKPKSGKGSGKPALAAEKRDPYVFKSLKGAADKQMIAFFSGRSDRSLDDEPEDVVETRMPDGFWEKPAKEAALALAEANRTATHRAHWKLAIDDRDGIAPPESGWLVHSWGSSGCYSFSSHQIALSFGVAEPVLAVIESNSIGVVGRNAWADQPGHSARLIPLAPDEARFLADTVFWLDRIRSWSPEKDDDRMFGLSSTADGHASIDLHETGKAPHQLASGTVWATSEVSSRWKGDYNREVFVNLAELLFGSGLPKRLGERWEVAPEVERHSLVTPTSERLEGRESTDLRQQLSETLGSMLDLPDLPASVLAEIVQAAGDDSLVPLLPRLEGLSTTLPPRDDEDEEYEKLEKRFERDHFGNRLRDEPDEHREAWERLLALREKRRFDPAAVLREPLQQVIDRLKVAQDAAGLMRMVMEGAADSRWALLQLRRLDPEAWAGLLEEQFGAAAAEERRQIFSTLAAGHPATAERLASSLEGRRLVDLIIEVSRFHVSAVPEAVAGDIPVLMELVKDREANYIRRIEAMELLSGMELPAEVLAEFTGLMVSEIRNPQVGDYGMGTRGSALAALGKLPAAGDHLDVFLEVEDPGSSEFSTLAGVLNQHLKDPDERAERMESWMRRRIETSSGMMSHHFITCLAFDLRGLASEIEAFASEGPEVADGQAAEWSGGSFEGPAGQRYHAAREISALWSETEAATRARMWICFAAAHAYEFAPERASSPSGEALRVKATEAVESLPREERTRLIEAALEAFPRTAWYPDFPVWLRSLG